MLKKNKLLSLIMSILFLALMLSSCYGNKQEESVGNSQYDSPPVVNTERVKRIAGGYWPAPPGFGGNLIGAQVGDVGYYVYESMFLVISGTDEVIPRLAKEYSHSEDNRKTTIKLVENRKWNDGTKFTSKDMWAYYLININNSAVTPLFEEFNIVDDYTLEVVWAEPVVSDTQKMLALAEGWQASTPYHIFGKYVDKVDTMMKSAKKADPSESKKATPFGLDFSDDQKKELKELYTEFKNVDMETPIGTGPYMVEKATNVQCDLKVNPHFPDADKLEFQKIILHTVSDYTSLLASGETDSFIGTFPYDMAQTILSSSKTMVMYPMFEQKSVGVIFNTRKKPLNDKLVRQAINEMINKKPIREIANFWAVESEYATIGLVNSSLEKHVKKEDIDKLQKYTGSVEKANSMMETAGWTKNNKGKWEDSNGRTYKMIIAANAGWGAQGISAANEVAEQLSKFGFDTEAKAVEATVVVSNMKEGSYDMLIDFLDMTWNISDPYRCFDAYYGEATEKAGIKLSEEPLILKDYDGKEMNMRELTNSLKYINDQDEYKNVVGKMVWATNDFALGVSLYQNVMAIWENSATSKGLPMESEFAEFNRMMPIPRTAEELEEIAILNRGFAPFAEVFVRNKVRPK